MPRPQGIICNLCNGEFFKNSYPIHRKKCEKKYVACNTACEFCGRMVPNSDMNMHVGTCKKRNKGVTLKEKEKRLQKKKQKILEQAAKDAGVDPDMDVDQQVRAMERKLAALKAAQKSAENAINIDPNNMKESGRAGKKIDLMAEIEKAANTIECADGADDDGRIPCSCCGRKFTAARICLHEDICLRAEEKRIKNKKKHKVKLGEDLRLKDTEFLKYKNRRAPEPEVKGKDWRIEARKLHQVVKEGRNVVRFQRAGVPLSELPQAGQEMELRVGHAVMTNDGRRGTVKFVGDVWGLPGDEHGAVRTFIGVEFNRPTGQNDGSIDGKRYFDGRPGHCSFMRPAKLLIVKTASGNDLTTNVRRKKNGYQKRKPPASETMTEFQKKQKNAVKKQEKKDGVVRRAAQLAAQRAARGHEIGKKLSEDRAKAGKMRSAQLLLEAKAESGEQDAIDELKRLKEAGQYIKIDGGFRSKELSKTKMGNKKVVETNNIPTFQEQKKSNPPTPPESLASPKKMKAPHNHKASTPNEPKPPKQRPQRSEKQIQAAAAAAKRAAAAAAAATEKTKHEHKTTADRLRKQVNEARNNDHVSSYEEECRRRNEAKSMGVLTDEKTPLEKKRERSRGSSGAQQRAERGAQLRAERAQHYRERPTVQKQQAAVSREDRAKLAAARRTANARVKQKKANNNASKENVGPQVRGQVKWSAAPGHKGATKRGDPYNGSGISDASRKYREKKAMGNGGVGNDMEAASAVYKARIRLKQRQNGMSKKKSSGYGQTHDPDSIAAKAQRAKNNAKGKAAFGSGAGSVADELNEHVFGKEKVKKKLYTADGKTKELTKARDRNAPLKKNTTIRGGGGNKLGSSPRQAICNTAADMGRGGKKLGGSVVKHRAMDPREARLAALAKRGL